MMMIIIMMEVAQNQSIFSYISFSLNLFFIMWYVSIKMLKPGNIFELFIKGKRKMRRVDCSFCFLLPNNVFLYRSEFLLMLPLVQTCINGS